MSVQLHGSGAAMANDPTIQVIALGTTTATPAHLADLLLAAPIVHRAALAAIEPLGDLSAVSIQRGSRTIADFCVTADRATAAVARLSLIAGLDPLAEGPLAQGGGNMGRAKVRAGSDVGEVLVTIGASPLGLRAEVHPLSINGAAPDLRAPGMLRRCPVCLAYQGAGKQVCDIDGEALVEVEDSPTRGGTIGAYRVLDRLGEGSGGFVLAAEHALLGRPAAIKVPQRSLSGNPVLTRRFLSEARAASRLRHPNIVDVTDFGLLPDGRPYMVMERVAGSSLRAVLARTGAFAPDVALGMTREMALALGAAHEAGIAHNDLKPANVIVLDGSTDAAPRLKLIDFGAASMLGAPDELLYGTPGYMAPERILGEPSDGRADLYSLGVMIYEMLEGAQPFAGLDLAQLLLAQVQDTPLAVRSPFGALPQAVTRLVSRALSKKPDQRHQSAAELVSDVDRALSALGQEGFRRWLP